MAIVTSSNKKSANTINSENLSQLDQVFSGQQVTAKTSEVETEDTVKKSASTKKREYTDTVVLNLPKGERNVFKVFCAEYNLTMTDFIYFSMDYVKDCVKNGKLSVGRSGIKELREE